MIAHAQTGRQADGGASGRGGKVACGADGGEKVDCSLLAQSRAAWLTGLEVGVTRRFRTNIGLAGAASDDGDGDSDKKKLSRTGQRGPRKRTTRKLAAGARRRRAHNTRAAGATFVAQPLPLASRDHFRPIVRAKRGPRVIWRARLAAARRLGGGRIRGRAGAGLQ